MNFQKNFKLQICPRIDFHQSPLFFSFILFHCYILSPLALLWHRMLPWQEGGSPTEPSQDLPGNCTMTVEYVQRLNMFNVLESPSNLIYLFAPSKLFYTAPRSHPIPLNPIYSTTVLHPSEMAFFRTF